MRSSQRRQSIIAIHQLRNRPIRFRVLRRSCPAAAPRSEGVFYDVAYDRSLDGPITTTGNGVAGIGAGGCVPGTAPTGYTTEFDEGIDLNKLAFNGGAPGADPIYGGGIASIDPTKLDRNPARNCAPVYPWEFVRTNTIFTVIHDAGGYTAWTDKHPSYSVSFGTRQPRQGR